MNDTLSAAAKLAAVLEQENAALAALDLKQATALLAEKQAAARLFAAAPQSALAALPLPDATRLRDLAEVNRRLLERAIAVQDQVLGLVATALRQPVGGGRYAATGTAARGGSAVAFALLARA